VDARAASKRLSFGDVEQGGCTQPDLAVPAGSLDGPSMGLVDVGVAMQFLEVAAILLGLIPSWMCY
jgi:hypothetical protein